jgi:hypothetical protein
MDSPRKGQATSMTPLEKMHSLGMPSQIASVTRNFPEMGRKLLVRTANPITTPPLHLCAINKQGNKVITKRLLTIDTQKC